MKDHKLTRISELPIFGGLPRSRLTRLGAIADEVTVSAGTTLVVPGGKSDFLVIEQGRAARRVEGGEPVELGRGDVFGELPLAHSHAAPVDETLEAETDLRMLVIRREAFPLLNELVPNLSGTLAEAVALHSGF